MESLKIIHMKKKVSKRGGYRPGAGAKKTGRNTTCISFSVHKDFAELIKSMVKSKIIELKQSQNQILIEAHNPPKPKKATVNSDYLQSRRSKKLGLK